MTRYGKILQINYNENGLLEAHNDKEEKDKAKMLQELSTEVNTR